MKPTNKEQLKEYCLTTLGAPVVEINVADEQVDQCVEEALQYFVEFHGDGTEKTYLKHKVTATTVTVPSSSNFISNELGFTSTGKSILIYDAPTPTTLRIVSNTVLLPELGETITGNQSGATGLISAIVYGDIDNGYIPTSDLIVGVNKVFPLTASIYGSGIFDIRYQLRLNDLFDLYSAQMQYYTNVRQHLSLIENLLVTDKQFRFNQLTNRLYIDMDWRKTVVPDEYVVVEAFRITDPETYSKVWNDRMLKKLTTAYIKRQWGMNMKKYSGVSIIGGLNMNGQIYYEEAMEDIEKTEAEIRDTYSKPPFFIMM